VSESTAVMVFERASGESLNFEGSLSAAASLLERRLVPHHESKQVLKTYVRNAEDAVRVAEAKLGLEAMVTTAVSLGGYSDEYEVSLPDLSTSAITII